VEVDCWDDGGLREGMRMSLCSSIVVGWKCQLAYLPPGRVNSNPPVVPVVLGQLITKAAGVGPLGFGW